MAVKAQKLSSSIFILALMLLLGCASATSESVTVEALSSPLPPTTETKLTKTIEPSNNSPKLTPGPEYSFLYVADGSIYRFNFFDWSTKVVEVTTNGQIVDATLSPNAEWLAYRDDNGVKISQQPFKTSIVISPSSAIWGNNLVFSENSQFLAYTDAEGLKINDLTTSKSTLLINHKLSQTGEISENQYYYPASWSSNNKWLLVGIAAYESQAYALFNIPTKNLHGFTNCYSDIDWLQNENVLAVSVTYSGQASCGEQDGLYVVSVDDDRVSETRIYADKKPPEPWQRATEYAQWSPSRKWISFAQVSNPESMEPATSSRLMVVRPDSTDAHELISFTGQITGSIWNKTGNTLFYISFDQKSQVNGINVETLENKELASLQERTELISLSPDGNYLLIKIERHKLLVIDLQSRKIVEVSGEQQISDQIFVGWEP